MGQDESTYGDDISQYYKSWGEEQIARFLDRNEIAYQYEYPLAIVDHGKIRVWYPDFRLPEYGIIIEYFGMYGNSNYDEQVRHKRQVFKKEGIDGLFLNRNSLRGDWPTRIMGQIKDILNNRIDSFNSRQYNRK